MYEAFATADAETVPSLAMKRKKIGNWIEVAVDNAGGVARVAAAMGTRKQTVYTWIDRGDISHLSVEKAVRFWELTRIDLAKLTGVDGLSLRARGGGERKLRPRRGKRKSANADQAYSTAKEDPPDNRTLRAADEHRETDGDDAS